MSNYLIYKHTSPSNKSYIGQTKNLSYRNWKHQHNSGCTAFYHAIQKYNWENFVTEILAENLTLEEANILEEQFIKEHNTLSPNGYNLRPGGLNFECLEETKAKISKAKQGKKQTKEHKQNRSISLIGNTNGVGKKKPQKLLTCPHCHKIGGATNMKRHHFDNCRLISNRPKFTHTRESIDRMLATRLSNKQKSQQ